MTAIEGGGAQVPRVGFVLEQTLGHITHSDNLVRLVGSDPRIQAEFAPIEYAVDPRWSRVPGHRNWTVRAGLRARHAVRDLRRSGPLDALFVHTQVPAMAMPDLIRRVPSVVSLDATPRQYDELGAHYGHETSGSVREGMKRAVHRSCFLGADRIVTWAAWTKAGLVEDYGVDERKIDVIPPGVEFDRWAAEARAPGAEGDTGPVRILFVGGDLERKGGRTLVESVRRLRADGLDIELDLVTRDEVVPEPGIRVHNGLGPNSDALIELYRRADVFCLPTLGDCLPMVLSEAGAVALPLVSTDVGAIREIVVPGETGLLVPPADEPALTAALGRLVGDPELRRRLGSAAQQRVRTDFNAATNAARLVELLVQVASDPR